MSQFISLNEYKELMAKLNSYQLPRGFFKNYVHRRFPETKNDDRLYKEMYFLVHNVKAGKSWVQGMELGIIEDLKEALQKIQSNEHSSN